MSSELCVFLDGERVGALAQTRRGNTTFTYDDRYRLDSRSTPLSLSMPLSRSQHPSQVVTAFLQGLLTDSPTKLAELAAPNNADHAHSEAGYRAVFQSRRRPGRKDHSAAAGQAAVKRSGVKPEALL
ncbi:HipA N-terminal domain-containing protein [Cryobacterium sp. Y50]|uniref:HipA N-terminal domain-containing protein n=1 Tax=Cryobacterium sp. Y50 TaxID=2048286 RepID=UPI000CE558ED|nr:HipA N-terminal domain-containing protein [Cryobacterium sp. Y50]